MWCQCQSVSESREESQYFYFYFYFGNVLHWSALKQDNEQKTTKWKGNVKWFQTLSKANVVNNEHKRNVWTQIAIDFYLFIYFADLYQTCEGYDRVLNPLWHQSLLWCACVCGYGVGAWVGFFVTLGSTRLSWLRPTVGDTCCACAFSKKRPGSAHWACPIRRWDHQLLSPPVSPSFVSFLCPSVHRRVRLKMKCPTSERSSAQVDRFHWHAPFFRVANAYKQRPGEWMVQLPTRLRQVYYEGNWQRPSKSAELTRKVVSRV